MLKKIIAVLSMSLTMSIFAGVFPVSTTWISSQCIPNPQVPSDTVSNFCVFFPQSVASCSPIKPGAGGPTKKYMNFIYTLMIETYGTLQIACEARAPQTGSTPAACVSQWNCYLHGGTSSDPAEPGQCSGTGQAC